MFAIIGYSTEKTIGHCLRFLANAGADYMLIDLSRLDNCRALRIEETPDDLRLHIDSDCFQLSDYDAFYQRVWPRDMSYRVRAAASLRVVEALEAFLQFAPRLVINRPYAGYSNASKFFHLTQLQEAGFSIPYSIISNDPEIRSTLSSDGSWVSKGLSGTRTIVRVVDDGLYSRLDHLVASPTLFQSRLHGPDVRIHVIGDQVISTQIDSDEVDYRYPCAESSSKTIRFEHMEAPSDVAMLCLRHCRSERLVLAGYDFKIVGNKWYILECNPMPGFDYYDEKLEHRIVKCLIETLSTGKFCPSVEPQLLREAFISSDRRPSLAW